MKAINDNKPTIYYFPVQYKRLVWELKELIVNLMGWMLTPWRRSIYQRHNSGLLIVWTNHTLPIWNSQIKLFRMQKVPKSRKLHLSYLIRKKYYFTTTISIFLPSLRLPVNIWIFNGNLTGKKSMNISILSSILRKACTRTTTPKSNSKLSKNGGKIMYFIVLDRYGTKPSLLPNLILWVNFYRSTEDKANLLDNWPTCISKDFSQLFPLR